MNPAQQSYKARTLAAIASIIFGYFCYSIADLCAKILQSHYSVYQVLAVSGSIGFLITFIWLLAKHGPKSFIPKNPRLHLLRACFVLGTAYFMVRALRTLPLADFYGIVFIMPFLVMILAIVILKEHVGWRRWAAAGVAFTGVLILAGPQFHQIGEGVICALIGSLCAASNIISLRKIGHGEPMALYGLYPFLFIAVFHLCGLAIGGEYVPFRIEDLPVFIVHGPTIVLGIIFISTGFARAPETAIVAPFHYTQIIWGVLFGWLFFQKLPTETTWTGLALVVGAGLYSLWREYRLSHHKE